ncbi:DoxX family protein [Dyadobacter arcticus]|uniref:Oxidoreductase n=1 Tax=Dyadobacter arcticus TaxID=1078754 RepID=A0ABX0UH73_9BACT|nr:DoxX family protein [Dyadobacter arcticus]NIJ52368.1 putative oxidoreductase [Dyadobacter arcticus]
MDRIITPTLVLRITLAAVFFMHGSSIFTGAINNFGNLYLNEVGFAPIGMPLAWVIKLSHVAYAVLLILNRYVRVAALTTIPILVAGIIMIHAAEGWFVVGAGRNGVEFNVLLISVLVYLAIINKKGVVV